MLSVGCQESYNDPLQVGTTCQHLFQPIKGSHGQHQETTPVNFFKSSATLRRDSTLASCADRV